MTEKAERQVGLSFPFSEPKGTEIREGEITARSGVQCSVKLSGTDTPVENIFSLSSYASVVGQQVWVAQFGGHSLILGAIGTDNAPYCRARRTSPSQTIGYGMNDAISWHEAFQNVTTPDPMWQSGNRVYARVPGWYFVSWAARWQAGYPRGERAGGVWKNNDSEQRYGMHGWSAEGQDIPHQMTGAAAIPLAAGEYVSLWVWHTAKDGAGNAVSLNIDAAFGYSTSMILHWLGPF